MKGMRPFTFVVGVIVVTVLCYFPTFALLHSEWTDTGNRESTHGYLIVALCLWMIWDRRRLINSIEPRLEWAGVAALIVVSLAWLLALTSNIFVIHVALMPIVLLCAIFAGLGLPGVRATAFPVLFLYFGLPVWGPLSHVLQLISIGVVRTAVRLSGIPAAFEGEYIHLSAGSIQIEDACSGIHGFVVGAAIAALYGAMNGSSIAARFRLLALMALLAMISNWLRIYAIVVAGHLTDMTHFLITVDHYWFGWGLFAICLVIFFLLAPMLDKPQFARKDSSPSREIPAPSMNASTSLVSIVALSMVPIAGLATAGASAPIATGTAYALPVTGDSWVGPLGVGRSEWRPNYEGATQEARAAYESGRFGTVQVYVARYGRQSQGAELVSHLNSIVGSGREEAGTTRVTAKDGARFAESLAIDARGNEYLIWWRFDVGGREVLASLPAQLWSGLDAMAGRPMAGVIGFEAACLPDCDAARQALDDFAVSMAPSINPPPSGSSR